MNCDDDSRDGILFRFWIRAACYPGGFPVDLMKALKSCHAPADYRRELTALAKAKGVNLPHQSATDEIVRMAGDKAKELREALYLVLDSIPAHDFPTMFGLTEDQGRELRELAGLSK